MELDPGSEAGTTGECGDDVWGRATLSYYLATGT
jgi:hypothetical protein